MEEFRDATKIKELWSPFFTEWMEKSKELFPNRVESSPSFDFGLNPIFQGWQHFIIKSMENPFKIFQSQSEYWSDFLTLCEGFNKNIQENIDSALNNIGNAENLLNSEEWASHYFFDFIKQSYFLLEQHLQQLAKNIACEDEKTSQKLDFFIRQLVHAFSPNNFIHTNPELLHTTLTSRGENLIKGFQHFLSDSKKGLPLIPSLTDLDFFEVGRNLAITPGKIIFQNDVMQLIQYLPTTSKVAQHPLLIIPPWINKFYIFDLQPENSFVRWILSQGQTVFLISWVNPDHRHGQKSFYDYLQEGPVTALEVIEKITGESAINTLGYCIGGTLLACTLAYLSAQKKCHVLSATFLTTLLDFSVPGDLGLFIDEKQVNALEKVMAKKGYLDGQIMSTTFNLLKANDLIWRSYVNHYLKGQKPIPFDFLFWNSDPTNIPSNVHSFYLREMYLYNNLIKSNAIKMGDICLDLANITLPCYFLATQEDHIVPWTSSYQGLNFLKNCKRFVLADSGHVAGVINSPKKTKYGYRVSNSLPDDPLEWLKNSVHQQGSWWQDWIDWLSDFSGEQVPARKISSRKVKILEDAPGSYVKQRF